MTQQIKGDDLLAIGYTRGKTIGIALDLSKNNFNDLNPEAILTLLTKVKDYPESFLGDDILGMLAIAMMEEAKGPVSKTIALRENPNNYSIYGTADIEDGAKKQMNVAMRLPVTVSGALMPDAHQGYGLPIGGVLATRNTVIPYGVGVDIGCRMALSVYDISEQHFIENLAKYKRDLIAQTKFGAGAGYHGQYKSDHEVLTRGEFNLTPFIRQLHDKAWTQLGSSGGGNHFVEWGIIEFPEGDESLNVDKGRYLALLSHSGSRGFGATIAVHYTRLAKDICKLPQEAVNLAYLDMNTDLGREYWLAMNLAGDYASACHEIIHQKLTEAVGGKVLVKVENHHNFAWKEMLNGEELIVHRKGATPAGTGVMGIIPGSMTAPGFLVRGKGDVNAINSASHGAGRQMSRTRAIQNISRADMKDILTANNVTLIGAGLDEAPMAYKDIHKVMASQKDLVEIIGKFTPKIVRMADDGSKED